MSAKTELTSLLPSGQKSIRHVLHVDTAAYSHRLSVLGDREGIQLRKVDLNTIVHVSQGCECPMVAVVGEEWNVEVVGKLDLQHMALDVFLPVYTQIRPSQNSQSFEHPSRYLERLPRWAWEPPDWTIELCK